MSPVQAAVTAATSLGVRCDDPVVLHDGSNVVVHLRPAPVVARVATLTARVRPGIETWFHRDARVARHATARGVLATRPIAPAVTADGFVVGLWHHEPHDPDHVPTPADVATRLFDLHVALRDFAGDLPRLGPCEDLARGFALLEGTVPEPALAVMRADSERLGRAVAAFPAQPVHGDAHPRNLLATPSGLMWNDFQDAWRGPVGWDLACLAVSTLVDGAAAVAAYPAPVADEEFATCLELRRLYAVTWPLVAAERSPDGRADAEENLARWLAAR